MQHMENGEQQLAANQVRSLYWANGALIDWVAGGKVLRLDGTIEGANVSYSYRFDAAVVSPCGEFVVLYEKLGTKGLILSQGTILREINRSFYHADAYEYPIAIFQTDAGRVLLAHCPEEYCQLELEDIQSGERISSTTLRKPNDFFHSRLRVSPDGKWLLSAGWIWHPWDALALYDLDAALLDSAVLDSSAALPDIAGEVVAAEFMADNRVLLATSDESLDDETTQAGVIGRNSLAVFEPTTCEVISCTIASEPAGALMPIDHEVAVGFYGHPKLFSLKTGAVLKRWEAISSGKQTSSIIWHDIAIPPIACDNANRRFAVAQESFVSVVDVAAVM